MAQMSQNENRSKPYVWKWKKCNHCMHTNDVEIFSIENLFCSHWVQVTHKDETCSDFKGYNIPEKHSN